MKTLIPRLVEFIESNHILSDGFCVYFPEMGRHMTMNDLSDYECVDQVMAFDQKKNWNDFALFCGQYWKVTWNENFGDWPGGKMWGLPFQDRRHYNVGTCNCLGKN